MSPAADFSFDYQDLTLPAAYAERKQPCPSSCATAGLLILSNVFMTFAWYAHLKNLSDRPWYVAALVSWGIALFEYLLQVPANRIGYTASVSASSRSCRR